MIDLKEINLERPVTALSQVILYLKGLEETLAKMDSNIKKSVEPIPTFKDASKTVIIDKIAKQSDCTTKALVMKIRRAGGHPFKIGKLWHISQLEWSDVMKNLGGNK